MKNKKLLTQTIGSVSTAVDAKEGNLIFEIPIISSLFEDSILISAVYNSNNSDLIEVFGNKTRMNYYREFIETQQGYTVKDAYGNEEEFIYENGEYINNKTLTKLIVNTNILDDESEEITFTLRDKHKNEIVYLDLSNYPTEIRRKDMSNILTSQAFFGFYKSNGEKVTFNSQEKCSKASYFKDGTDETYSTSLEYDTQNRLIKVTNPLGEEHEFEYGSDYIKIKHSPTNSYLKFIFTNNKVTKIESGVLRGTLTPNELLFTYNTDYTKLTYKEPNMYNSYHTKESYVFFDNEGRLSYEFDELGYGYKVEYNGSNNIAFEGNVLNLKENKNNQLLGIETGEYTALNIIGLFSKLSQKEYIFNGELKYKDVYVKSNDNTLSFLAKGSGTLNLYINNVLTQIPLTNKYTLHQVPICKERTHLPLKIQFFGQATIAGVKLQSGSAGRTYEYDANKNLRKVIDGRDEVVYIYSTENKLLQIKENGKVVKKYGYQSDENYNTIIEEKPYNSITTTNTEKANDNNYQHKRIINEYLDEISNYTHLQSFDGITESVTVGRTLTDGNVLQIKTLKTYNQLGQLITNTNYSDGKLINNEIYSYVNKMLKNVKKYNENAISNIYTKDTSYLYHTYNPYLLSESQSLNEPTNDLTNATHSNIRYEYYTNELLKAVYVDNVLVESFEYFGDTSILIVHKYSNGQSYGYTYDEQNRPIKVEVLFEYTDEDGVINYQSTQNGFTFEYDDEDLLVKVNKLKNGIETEIEEYVYEEGILTKIKNGSFEKNVLFDTATNNGYISHTNGTDSILSRSQDNVDYHKKIEVDDTPTYLNSDDKTIYYSSTTYYNSNKTLNDKYSLYPLHKSLVSLKGDKVKSFKDISSDSFVFDDMKHKKVLELYNKLVTFEHDYQDGLSAMCNLKVMELEESIELLSLSFNEHNAFITKDSTGQIKLRFNDQTYNTSLELKDTDWHKLGIRLNEYTQYDNEDNEYCYLGFNIILDDNHYGIGVEFYEVIDKVEITLGNVYCVTVRYEMLALGKTSNLTDLKNEYTGLNKITTKVETYSCTGILIREQIYNESTLVLDKAYDYNYDVGFTPILKTETLNIKDKVFEYLYTYENGNVKTYNDREYVYDDAGRIKKVNWPINNMADVSCKNTSWSYDNKGNILTTNKYTFEYDDQNRLIKMRSFDNPTQTVLYTNDNIFLPTLYNGNTLQYEGNKLIQFENSNYKVNFEYNQDGLRTKKTVLNKTTFSTKTYYFYYNGYNLVRQEWEQDNQREYLDFLYDSKGELFAFETTDGNRYYYLRNNLKDICNIVDKNGNRMVKYEYVPYGEIVSKVDMNYPGQVSLCTDILNINPFTYKGYYYDEETQLFYCNSRYYSPELCRWISPDSIEYLDPQSINGLNLYCYCYNNPISYSDPSGNLPQWAKWAIGAGVIAILAVATVLTAGAAGVGVGAAFAAGFAGSAIGVGASGLAVTIAGSAFAGAVIGAGFGLIGGALVGGISSGSWSGALEGAANGFMMGSITGAISGGIRGGINYARTSPLIRSVSADELNSIKSTGQFSSSGYSESKWFATNSTDASKWANWFGQSDYVGIRVPKSAFKNFYFNPVLDNIGPAYNIEIGYLNSILKGIWYF